METKKSINMKVEDIIKLQNELIERGYIVEFHPHDLRIITFREEGDL